MRRKTANESRKKKAESRAEVKDLDLKEECVQTRKEKWEARKHQQDLQLKIEKK